MRVALSRANPAKKSQWENSSSLKMMIRHKSLVRPSGQKRVCK
jgi:hypothetical protein